MRRYALLFILSCTIASSAIAQPSNLESFQALALRCVELTMDTERDVIIDTPARMPFIKSAIIAAFKDAGRQVYLADSTYKNQPANLPKLRYQIDGAYVSYKRQKKKRAHRTVQFDATFSLLSENGSVLNNKVCQEKYADTVTIAALAALENPSYAETRAPHPDGGFFKRMVQPVMLTAATVLTVYLFFTLRSDSSNDG